MSSPIKRVERAIAQFNEGKMVILTDDTTRENEGDLVIPAERITPEIMTFMIRQGSGIVCVASTSELLNKIDCQLMIAPEQNTSAVGTPFTISIDARDGIESGVSANDRTATVLAMVNDDAKPEDLVRPGHMFPLLANERGVFGRNGHTEGSVDLARIAGFKPAAVICEIMNPDGSMTRGEELTEFAAKYDLPILSINDIIEYRLTHEELIEDEATAVLPIEDLGEFTISVYREKYTNKEHICLSKERKDNGRPHLARIHSACTTGDIFHSARCDCYHQLHYSLKRISDEGGVLIYLSQEGRDIGLLNKIKAYALQDQGHDTVVANQLLGLHADPRTYDIAAHILRKQNINSIRMLTNNLAKYDSLNKFEFLTIEREATPVFENVHNREYLKTKKDKLKHDIDLKDSE